MLGQGTSLATGLLGREQAILTRYRARLEQLGSPLVADAGTWGELAVQARRILGDCAESLRTPDAEPTEADLPGVIDMAVRRGGKGIHPRNSVRASVVLFDVVLDEVRTLTEGGDTRQAADAVARVAFTLNRGIGARLEAGAVGYDTFLLNQVREVIEADRRELAREIHDRFGNSVSLAMRRLELAAHEAASRTHPPAEQISAAQAVLTDALHELRELITGLRSGFDGALQAALHAYVASVRASRPAVTVAVNGIESWAPPDTLDEVFLILREALRNVFAHADADRATVKVNVAPHEVRATVEDDGLGFDPGVPVRPDSHGISSMRERAETLSGTLHVRSMPGNGTRVHLWIPLHSLGS